MQYGELLRVEKGEDILQKIKGCVNEIFDNILNGEALDDDDEQLI